MQHNNNYCKHSLVSMSHHLPSKNIQLRIATKQCKFIKHPIVHFGWSVKRNTCFPEIITAVLCRNSVEKDLLWQCKVSDPEQLLDLVFHRKCFAQPINQHYNQDDLFKIDTGDLVQPRNRSIVTRFLFERLRFWFIINMAAESLESLSMVSLLVERCFQSIPNSVLTYKLSIICSLEQTPFPFLLSKFLRW